MDFDKVRDARVPHSSKWSNISWQDGTPPDDVIAMWVADMEFDAAPCIRAALQETVDLGFIGYFGDAGPVNDAVCGWMADQHGWQVQPDWIRYSHGVVAGFAMVLEAFSDPGDSIILFTPVYHAFFGKARAKGREILQSHLVIEDGQYQMDLTALAAQLTGREKIVILCSPHNPGGRLWSAEEIRELAVFCAEHDLILCSDEIHMDLAFPGARHIPTAVAAPDITPRLVTITAASKGFNIAGGETGFIIVEDTDLRARFDVAHKALGGTPNRFGMLMTKAAFTDGHGWSQAVREYIAANFAIWRDRIGALPGVTVMDMQSTYLSWVNFEDTGLSSQDTARRLQRDARIAMSPGAVFGEGGETYQRFNIALPRPTLLKAITRIEGAFADLQ